MTYPPLRNKSQWTGRVVMGAGFLLVSGFLIWAVFVGDSEQVYTSTAELSITELSPDQVRFVEVISVPPTTTRFGPSTPSRPPAEPSSP